MFEGIVIRNSEVSVWLFPNVSLPLLLLFNRMVCPAIYLSMFFDCKSPAMKTSSESSLVKISAINSPLLAVLFLDFSVDWRASKATVYQTFVLIGSRTAGLIDLGTRWRRNFPRTMEWIAFKFRKRSRDSLFSKDNRWLNCRSSVKYPGQKQLV